ncbi:MAG TPA: hypothetical protein VGZ29_08630 [Terriglobia bacterium]|nr:hypothetical protein [Terriglobia bacterium]
MRDTIVEKLSRHLADPVDTECKVVYLLCEVRKLLDEEPTDSVPFALRLYCHWALHVDLSYRSTTIHFLKRVDNYVFDKLTAAETMETILAEGRLLRDFLYLETFRRELAEFLRTKELDTSICDDNERWFTFLAAYAGVIQDGSLTCSGSEKLKIVSRVTFTRSGRAQAEGHVLFDMNWDVSLRDGRRLEISVGTQANHELMRLGLRLIAAPK